MATQTELTGGGFQDSEGNPLEFGYLKMHLSQDCLVSGVGNICSGIDITINLDIDGNAIAGQSVWSNLVMSPQNNFYRVTGYTSEGQKAWGPNNQQVGSGSTFNLDLWVPNTVISWFPEVQQPLLIEIGGVPNDSQTILDFESSDNSVTISNPSGGLVNLQASGGGFQNLIGCNAAGVITADFGLGACIGMYFAQFNSPTTVDGGSPTATEGKSVLQQGQFPSSAGAMEQVFSSTLGILQEWFTKVEIQGTTDSRYYFGLCDQTPISAGAAFYSDTPAANFVGFRFSSTADGANISAICQTSASNQTVVSTSIAALDNIVVLKMVPSGGSVKFYINGTLVATISTNVPSNSLPLASILTADGMDNGSSDQQFAFFYIYELLSN